MIAALGSYGEFVYIRDPEQYQIWRGRQGLRCLACHHPVWPYEAAPHRNVFLRHGKTDAQSGAGRSGVGSDETFLHAQLKYWVRTKLRGVGVADAEVEVAVGGRFPDVYGHHNGRGFAVEIQWSALSEDLACERTADLLSAGCDDVVWLTRPCAWVPRVPSIGIKDFEPANFAYQAFTGTFKAGATGMQSVECPVEVFLQRWIVGDLHWAYIDSTKAGWATVTDWRRHTKQQADTIAELEDKLQGRMRRLGDLQQDLDRAREDTVTVAATANELRRELADQQSGFEQQLQQQRDTAAAEAAQAKKEVEAAQTVTRKLGTEHDYLNRQLAAAQQRIAAMKSSRNWSILIAVAAVAVAIGLGIH